MAETWGGGTLVRALRGRSHVADELGLLLLIEKPLVLGVCVIEQRLEGLFCLGTCGLEQRWWWCLPLVGDQRELDSGSIDEHAEDVELEGMESDSGGGRGHAAFYDGPPANLLQTWALRQRNLVVSPYTSAKTQP